MKPAIETLAKLPTGWKLEHCPATGATWWCPPGRRSTPPVEAAAPVPPRIVPGGNVRLFPSKEQ